MNQLEDMRLFVQTVDSGSFTAAGEKLGLSKQFVSRRLAALEARLGVRLLIRTTRSLRTTALGMSYHEQASRLVQEVDAAEQSITRQNRAPRGRLRITAPMSFGTMILSPALPRFIEAHPQLSVELQLNDRSVDLVGEGYDAGVRIGTLPDSSMIAHRVAEMDMLVCCSPGYRQRRGTPQTPADLREHDCLPYGHAPKVAWNFLQHGKPRAVAINGRLCANNGELLRDAACAGLGLTQLPAFIVAAQLQNGELISVLDDCRPPPLGVHVIYPGHRQSSLAVQAFADFLRVTLADPVRAAPPAKSSAPVL
ncbi:LysR family transcriptional regulator [Solimonas terrae]|uniref:LysR family transcriptional regulator n=1 Tax=Solimonas terrae TaxID=1396819 RepID=A0A6M2BWY8_9GAMM|nr:LysR family transcriptional regulator [Solimonas terrae]NGY06850.1 LysR family transcriptional regulator [Solimonas terrae]